MKLHFDDEDFDGQLQRGLAYAPYGGADPGELLAAASRIAEGNRDSWYAEFLAAAERARAAGDAARGESARLAYLRASNYARMAEFYVRDSDADGRSTAAWRLMHETFAEAARRMDPAGEAVAIRYEDRTLPGYLFRVDGSGAARPTVIAFPGFDSHVEEQWGLGAAAAVARGYNVLAFEGPGQGGVLRVDGLPLRPDWEAVITPVVDFAAAHPEVDAGRIALLGRSLGGYLAPRGVTGEPRVAALIVDPGQYDLGGGATARLPEELREKVLAGDPETDRRLDAGLDDPARAFYYAARMRPLGVAHLGAMIRALQPYTLEGRFGAIRCPTLVCDNESDPIAGGQSRGFFDRLSGPKAYVRFTAEEGAGGHCEGLGQVLFHARVYDWLDGVLRP